MVPGRVSSVSLAVALLSAFLITGPSTSAQHANVAVAPTADLVSDQPVSPQAELRALVAQDNSHGFEQEGDTPHVNLTERQTFTWCEPQAQSRSLDTPACDERPPMLHPALA